jgi:hypothetical protein
MKSVQYRAQRLGLISLLALASASTAAPRTSPLVVDHTYNLSSIPETVLERLRAMTDVVHFAHRSDGSAMPWGLEKLSDLNPGRMPFGEGYLSIPNTPTQGIRFWDGMSRESYVTPELYWQSHAGREDLRTILQGNASIKYTSWTWCNEDDYWDLADRGGDNASLGAYFRIMDSLERALPNVTFIYQTAAMRETGTEESNVKQAIFNQTLRDWAIRNNKILFDVADLDTWSKGVQNLDTFEIRTNTGVKDTIVPFIHPDWVEGNGPTTGWHHANDSMGIDKGKAWWYLMARLTGWEPTPSSIRRTLNRNPALVSERRYLLNGKVGR